MLTDTQIKKAKATEKAYKISDSGGLYLQVATSGSKLWRLKYRVDGKEKLLALGPYPDVSLADARAARDKAKSELREGKDPSVIKKMNKFARNQAAINTFEQLAREWYALQKPQWVERHAADVIDSLEKEVFPHIGSKPIKELNPTHILPVLRLIEQRGAIETARRVRQRLSAVFVYGIATGRATDDPAATVQKAMAPLTKGRQPAIIDLAAARIMLADSMATPSHPVTKLALRILALTAVRPGTLITTPWVEWNEEALDQGLWQIPAERMKLRLQYKNDESRDHLVPLARQTVEAIRTLKRLTGRGPMAMPNARHAHKPMSENAIGYLLNRAGYHHKHVPHGWRATFSSVMNERFPADRPIIDLMLAHTPKDKVEAAYNRAKHLERRTELAQIWADLILEGAPAANDLLVGPRKILT
jgi:integrase